jgi:hypothetical protein
LGIPGLAWQSQGNRTKIRFNENQSYNCHFVAFSEDAVTKREDVVTKREDVVTKSEDVVTKSEDVVTKREDVVTKSEDAVTKSEDGGFYCCMKYIPSFCF